MSETANAKPGWTRRDTLWALLLTLATMLAYQPAWHGAAVFDDSDHLTPPELQSLEGLGRIWTEVGVVSQYYPVTHSFFWLQQQLWGDAMTGYHFATLLLHVGVALLLVHVMRQLELPGAWLAGALFALHPVHVESVAWISEQKNTLSTLLYLVAALACLKFEHSRSPRTYVVALGWFVLALGAKTVVASLPAALLVVTWWRRGKLDWRNDVRPLVPFFVLGAAAGLFTAWVERRFIGADGTDFTLGVVERGLVAGRALWFYVGNVVWPADLAFIYPRWNVRAGDWLQYLWPAAAIVVLAAACFVRRRTRAPLAVALLFTGTLFPVLGFLNVYPFVYSFVADHYQYLANVALIAALAAALTLAVKRVAAIRPQVGVVAAMILLGGLAALTWRESRNYTDAETLWRATLARNPDAFVAHSNLANCLFETGRTDEALRHARRALELKPRFAELHNNLGHFLLELGRLDEALASIRTAVELRPGLAQAQFSLAAALLRRADVADRTTVEQALQRAIAVRPDFVRARTVLAGVYLDAGRVDEAVVLLEAALRVRPDDADANNNLGNAQLRLGRNDEAVASYRRAIAAAPTDFSAHHNLGAALTVLGRSDEAKGSFRRAMQLNPDFVPARVSLGLLEVESGNTQAALEVLRRAVAIEPAHAVAQNALGVALMQTGAAIDEAIIAFRAAVQADPTFVLARENLARAEAMRNEAAAPALPMSPVGMP